MASHYETLGVERTASAEEIRKAYRKLARTYHPDRPGGDASKFAKVNEAFSVISDANKRAQYDSHLRFMEQFGTTGRFQGEQFGSKPAGFGNFGDFNTWANGRGSSGYGRMQGDDSSFFYNVSLDDLLRTVFYASSSASGSGGFTEFFQAAAPSAELLRLRALRRARWQTRLEWMGIVWLFFFPALFSGTLFTIVPLIAAPLLIRVSLLDRLTRKWANSPMTGSALLSRFGLPVLGVIFGVWGLFVLLNRLWVLPSFSAIAAILIAVGLLFVGGREIQLSLQIARLLRV